MMTIATKIRIFLWFYIFKIATWAVQWPQYPRICFFNRLGNLVEYYSSSSDDEQPSIKL